MDIGPTSSRSMNGARQHLAFPNNSRRKAVVKMTLEARLVQAHVMLEVIPKDRHGSKSVPLAQYGAYEVRLVEPAVCSANCFIFWIELFDRAGHVSIDSGGANDLEEASAIADDFALRAAKLGKK
jgi:hypothetical protein